MTVVTIANNIQAASEVVWMEDRRTFDASCAAIERLVGTLDIIEQRQRAADKQEKRLIGRHAAAWSWVCCSGLFYQAQSRGRYLFAACARVDGSTNART